MTDGSAVMKPAATVLLLRDGEPGLEVFMVERHRQVDFASGAMVFPGGKVDAGDGDPALRARCAGAEGLDDTALAFRIAAIREAFEECGVLLARPRGEAALIDAARLQAIESRFRDDLNANKVVMRDIVEAEDLELACDRLVHYAHWITPSISPKRFDTHFFLVEAPSDHVAVHDGGEAVDSVWIAPDKALADSDAGRVTLVFATIMNLQKLGRSADVAAALAAAAESRVVPVEPQVTMIPGGRRLRIPAEADYGITEIVVDEAKVPSASGLNGGGRPKS